MSRTACGRSPKRHSAFEPMRSPSTWTGMAPPSIALTRHLRGVDARSVRPHAERPASGLEREARRRAGVDAQREPAGIGPRAGVDLQPAAVERSGPDDEQLDRPAVHDPPVGAHLDRLSAPQVRDGSRHGAPPSRAGDSRPPPRIGRRRARPSRRRQRGRAARPPRRSRSADPRRARAPRPGPPGRRGGAGSDGRRCRSLPAGSRAAGPDARPRRCRRPRATRRRRRSPPSRSRRSARRATRSARRRRAWR